MAPLEEQIPFSDLCAVLDAVTRCRGQSAKRSVMLKFVNAWREMSRLRRQHGGPEGSFYPILRLLLPWMDKDRRPLGIKEHTLARRLIEALAIDKGSADARRLLQFRQPGTSRRAGGPFADTGDFAAIADSIVKARINGQGGASIADVNRCLDRMAEGTGERQSETIREQILWFCKTLQGNEVKWFIRILLKELKIGMTSEAILTLYHPQASELYDVRVSLKSVCDNLPALDTSLKEVGLCLMKPFRPMLACLVLPDKVPLVMHGQPFYVETKFDGERVQLHRDGETYRYYSRRAIDQSSSYGATPSQGTLTPYIHKAFSPSVRNCILDGEMMGWNTSDKCFVTKGDHISLKHLQEGEEIHPYYIVFDCLLLNDVVLTGLKLIDRLKRLREVLYPVDERLMIIEQRLTTSAKEVVEALAEAINCHDEGLIIKDPQSTYKFNVRRLDAGWLKIKPDYIHGLGDQLDLLIVGGYFGKGRRSNFLSHFMLAVLDERTTDQAKPTFLSVCKVSSGYTMHELHALNIRLTRGELSRSCPPWLQLAGEKAEVYVDINQSAVVQVKATQIVVSQSFGAGYTLRFPRVQTIRRDKGWKDSTTLAELFRLREISHAERASRLTTTTESVGTRKRRGPPKALLHLSPSKRLTSIRSTSALFAGREFCILSGDDAHSKDQLEEWIVQNGGSVVQQPGGATTFCCIAPRPTVRVRSIAQGKLVDVVKTDWLVRCVDSKTLLPWHAKDMLFATDKTRAEIGQRFDRFGDSYTQPIANEAELLELCGSMQPENVQPLPDVVNYLKTEMANKYSALADARIYVDLWETAPAAEKSLETVQLERFKVTARLYGAKTVDSVDESTTHVLVHSNEPCRMANFIRTAKQRRLHFEVVDEKWLLNRIRHFGKV